MTDSIVYVVYSLPGGLDGMDNKSMKCKMLYAFATRELAEKCHEKNKSTTKIVAKVYNLDSVSAKAKAKLSPIERFALFGR
jgi:hypothetical protein